MSSVMFSKAVKPYRDETRAVHDLVLEIGHDLQTLEAELREHDALAVARFVPGVRGASGDRQELLPLPRHLRSFDLDTREPIVA
jgi:hypothetical protein